MKSRTLLSILILILALLIVVGSCATGKKAYVVKEDEELFGTWINPDYNNTGHCAKYVFHHNGKVEYYSATTDRAADHGEFVITNKWADVKGNICYTMIEEFPFWGTGRINYILAKISNSGKTLEFTWTHSDYPTEIDPEHSRYNIYYRQ
jgi:hypothetical protein